MPFAIALMLPVSWHRCSFEDAHNYVNCKQPAEEKAFVLGQMHLEWSWSPVRDFSWKGMVLREAWGALTVLFQQL